MGDRVQAKLDACLGDKSDDLFLNGLELGVDGAKRVGAFLPKWCVRIFPSSSLSLR